MATVTVATIRTRSREKADMVGSNFISSSEQLSYINESYRAFYDIIVSRFEDYNLGDPTTFTVSSGTPSYNLPSDFYKCVGVDRQIGTDHYYPLQHYPWKSRNRSFTRYYSYSNAPLVGYRIVGTKIRFVPEDQAAGDYRLWYIPLPTALTQDSDTIEGYNGFEELVVVDTAIKMLAKEESDISYLLNEKREIIKRIEKMAQLRDIAEVDCIEEATADFYDRDFYR